MQKHAHTFLYTEKKDTMFLNVHLITFVGCVCTCMHTLCVYMYGTCA